jgi:hypothetical protein
MVLAFTVSTYNPSDSLSVAPVLYFFAKIEFSVATG